MAAWVAKYCEANPLGSVAATALYNEIRDRQLRDARERLQEEIQKGIEKK